MIQRNAGDQLRKQLRTQSAEMENNPTERSSKEAKLQGMVVSLLRLLYATVFIGADGMFFLANLFQCYLPDAALCPITVTCLLSHLLARCSNLVAKKFILALN
jgi:hypothetical protein